MKNILTLCLLFVCCSCVTAQAATYYVDNTHANKSDTAAHAATDSTAPWGLIQSACSVAVAGDTVFIQGNGNTYDEDSPQGTYATSYINSATFRTKTVNIGFAPYNSGTSGNPIVFKGYPGYSRPIILGDSTSAGSRTCATLYERDYIKFDSLHFRRGYVGILVDASSYDSIMHCEIDDIGYYSNSGSNGGAIFVDGHGVKGDLSHLYVGYNEIHNIWPDGGVDSENPTSDGILDTGFTGNASALHYYYGDSLTVEHNHIYYVSHGIFTKGQISIEDQGYSPEAGGWHGQLPQDSLEHITYVRINHNYLHEVYGGAIYFPVQGQYENYYVHHNIIKNCGVPVWMRHYGNFFDPDWNNIRNIFIYNNTIVGPVLSSPAFHAPAIAIQQGNGAWDSTSTTWRPNGHASNVQIFNNLGVNLTNTGSPAGNVSLIQYGMMSHSQYPNGCGGIGYWGDPCGHDEEPDVSGIHSFFEGYNAAHLVGGTNLIGIGDDNVVATARLSYYTSQEWIDTVALGGHSGCTDCGTGDTDLTSSPVVDWATGNVTNSLARLATAGRGGSWSDTIGANWDGDDVFTDIACLFDHSLAAVDTQQNSITVENFYSFDTDSGATADSVFLIWDDDNSIASPLGSAIDSTGLGSPDTLTATGLTNGTTYYLWWVTYHDGCGADTSGYITLSTVASEGSTSTYNGGVPINGGTTLYMKLPEEKE